MFKPNMKPHKPYDPIAHHQAQIDAIDAQTAHWLATFEDQVARSLSEVLAAGLSTPVKSVFGTRLTYAEKLIKSIQSDAQTIRSWYAFGEPNAYGKAICAKVRVEKRMYAQMLIRAKAPKFCLVNSRL